MQRTGAVTIRRHLTSRLWRRGESHGARLTLLHLLELLPPGNGSLKSHQGANHTGHLSTKLQSRRDLRGLSCRPQAVSNFFSPDFPFEFLRTRCCKSYIWKGKVHWLSAAIAVNWGPLMCSEIAVPSFILSCTQYKESILHGVRSVWSAMWKFYCAP